MTVSLVGGVLGVLFTIPLRRALIVHARLRFPEGVATAESLGLGRPLHAGGNAGPFDCCWSRSLGWWDSSLPKGLQNWEQSLEGALQLVVSTFWRTESVPGPGRGGLSLA